MLIAQRPTLTEEQVDEYRSRFVIEPLEPGFGYTIGNSLRRTLLSSIPGAAVTSIRIEGVLHEFSTVPGVKEDVTDIILNLKELVVSSEHDEPVVMYLRKQGPGEVTAADIAPPAGVEVHNPELHIATLNGKAKLEMELTVERGRGYVSAAQNKQPGQEIGRIPIDSIYSPVLQVTYKVEATRVEQRTDFDRLILDVETKPAHAARATRWPAPARPWSSCSAWPASSTSTPRASTSARRRPTPRSPPTWRCRSRSSTSPSAPTTASSARASTPWVSSSPAASRTCSTSGTSAPSRSRRSSRSSHDMGLALKDSPPGFDPSAAAGAGYDDDDSVRRDRAVLTLRGLRPSRPRAGRPVRPARDTDGPRRLTRPARPRYLVRPGRVN